MATYKVTQKLVQKVIQIYWEDFDTSDQDQWECLKESLKDILREDKFDELPEKAPEDPAKWLALYRKLPRLDYENKEDDYWISDSKGTTEFIFIIQDEDGNEVIRED
jgi:hypothetical protein